MAVDRIQKTGKEEAWRVAATLETKEERQQGQEQTPESESSEQESPDSFGETSDFIQLLTKDPHRLQNMRLETWKIQNLIFRSIGTHRETAILEVDISMKDGTLFHGAQIAITRQEGMKYLGRKPGEEINSSLFSTENYLNVALPKPEEGDSITTLDPMISENTAFVIAPNSEDNPKLGGLYYFGIAVLVIAVISLIYIFVMV